MVWKFCEIWKSLWELASRWPKLCEILSHSVRYSINAQGTYNFWQWWKITNNWKTLNSTREKQNYKMTSAPSKLRLACTSVCPGQSLEESIWAAKDLHHADSDDWSKCRDVQADLRNEKLFRENHKISFLLPQQEEKQTGNQKIWAMSRENLSSGFPTK